MNADQQRLCEENINLVYSVIHKQWPRFIQDEDIVQVGMLGLCHAAELWDESKSKFSTYAWRCIANEIGKEFKRRKTNSQNISLETVLTDYMKVEDTLVGDTDVDYADTQFIMDNLQPREREVFEQLQKGVAPKDITKMYGWSKQRTNNIVRKIKALWRMQDG